MRKILFILLFMFIGLFGEEEPMDYALGVGTDGVSYISYDEDNTFMQYSLNLDIDGSSYDCAYYDCGYNSKTMRDYYLGASVYRGGYLFSNYQSSIDFAIKYKYGASVYYTDRGSNSMRRNYQEKATLYTDISAGLGVEIISPLQKGFSLEVMIYEMLLVSEDELSLSFFNPSFSIIYNL